jgi:hypothetical protein
MIIDTRIKYNGVNVRVVGWGFRKFHNLKILDAGIASIKSRLARGIGADDQKTKPLKKKYARYKAFARRKKPIRDLDLTGQLLDSIKPRYSDDTKAIADAGTRMGRMKARVHRDLLIFSEGDQSAMSDVAGTYFREGVSQAAISGSSSRRAAATARQTNFNRRTYFGRG